MGDIELVIKIPEKEYESCKKELKNLGENELIGEYEYAIANGIPLPKGHGRLIDADVLEEDIEVYSKGAFAMAPEFLVKDALTIIEADEESED